MRGIAGGGAIARAAAAMAVEEFDGVHARACAAAAPSRQGDVRATPFLLAPLRFAIGLALPPRCPGCGAITDADHRFCASCWTGLRFLGPPWCASCHAPFDHDRGGGARCGACLADPPAHDGVRAAVAYGDVARTVALRLKYGGRTGHAATMAAAMARLMPDDATLLVPVRLHRWRIWGRGFNQAALVADALSRRSGVPVAKRLLLRPRRTPPLRGMGPRARRRTVAGAFALAPGAADRLGGAHVVLVDDVHTSGATTDACVRLMKRAGAARVVVLCWARVLPGSDAAD